MSHPSKIAVVVATLGRADEVGDLLEELQKQTRVADHVVLSVTKEEDLPPVERRFGAEVIMGSKGLPAQRNRGMALILEGYDYLVFFDDDYLPSKNVIKGICDYFDAHSDVCGITGNLLADGINSPGISKSDALAMIADYDALPVTEAVILGEPQGLYGCNMAYRVSSMQDVTFDENLPLYAWQEDWDFANQLLDRGRLVHTDAFTGVHRGVKGARTRGDKLGYSQIANPIYLVRKGTMSQGKAYTLMIKNILANHGKSLWPEPWIDRWGRAKGNWRAIMDLIGGDLVPGKILDF